MNNDNQKTGAAVHIDVIPKPRERAKFGSNAHGMRRDEQLHSNGRIRFNLPLAQNRETMAEQTVRRSHENKII